MSQFNEEDLKDHKSVAAVIMDDQGRILTSFNTKNSILMLPTGKLLPGELSITGLSREMKEELDIDVSSAIFFDAIANTFIRDGHSVHVQTLIWRVSYSGEIKNMEPDKCKFLKWMSKDELDHVEGDLSTSLKHVRDHLDKFIEKTSEYE